MGCVMETLWWITTRNSCPAVGGARKRARYRATRTPRRQNENAMLKIVSTLLRRLRREFFQISGRNRSTRLLYRSSAHQFQRLRQLGEKLFAEFRIDVEERHTRNLVRAVFPGMVGPSLNNNIALRQDHFAVRKDEDDLAFDHYGVIESLGPMHYRTLAALVRGINIDDAQQVARHRHDREFPFVGLTSVYGCEPRNFIRIAPHLEELCTDRRTAHLVLLRRSSVGYNHGFSGRIMTGDDTSRFCHKNLLSSCLVQIKSYPEARLWQTLERQSPGASDLRRRASTRLRRHFRGRVPACWLSG